MRLFVQSTKQMAAKTKQNETKNKTKQKQQQQQQQQQQFNINIPMTNITTSMIYLNKQSNQICKFDKY